MIVWLDNIPLPALTQETVEFLERGPYSNEVVEIARDLVQQERVVEIDVR